MTHRGFRYTFTLKRAGVVVDAWEAKNLIPAEGEEYIIGCAFLPGVAKIPYWYAGLWAGSYTPTTAVTAATLPALTTEFVDYADTNRPPFAPSAATGGIASDTHEYTFTAAGTINGAFVSSAAAKNAGDGLLVSVVRFANARAVESGDVLEVTNTIGLQ